MRNIFSSQNRDGYIRIGLSILISLIVVWAGYMLAPVLDFNLTEDVENAKTSAERSLQDNLKAPVEFVKVVRDDFHSKVRGRGSVESVVNTDIINKVDGISTLTYVIDEGTVVRQGDVIARLDPQKCYNALVENLIIELRTKTSLITQQANLEKNLISLKEYVYGTFEQEWIKIENTLFENQQALRSKGDLRRYRQRMVQMGYSTKWLLDNYTASWEEARNNVYKSVWDQNVLLKHTSESKIASIVSMIGISDANTEIMAAVARIRRYYVCKAEYQLENCTIVAPCDGQVVYANQLIRVHHRSQANMIREGGAVTSGQLLFRIPGSDQIHVQTLINETDVSSLTTGMKASIVFGVDSSRTFEGVVSRINLYPEFVWRSSAKNYLISVEVQDVEQVRQEGLDLRTGISADVEIDTGIVKDALLVPLDCLLYWENETYCLTRNEHGFTTIPVKIGASDDTKAVVLEGLTEGMEVIAHASQFASEVVFPGMVNESPTENTETSDASVEHQTGELPGKDSSAQTPNQVASSSPSDANRTATGMPRESEQFRKQLDQNYRQELQNLEPIKTWFRFSSLEMCRMLDSNRDRTISRDEVILLDPAFLAFYNKWDYDRDGVWSLVDFVFYFHKARALWLESHAEPGGLQSPVSP